jgi:hypothetical protein
MNRNTLIGVVVLLLALGGIIWFAAVHRKTNETVIPLLSVSAFNQTQNADATTAPARAQDQVTFTLTAQNQTDKTIPGYVIEANISQITDKSTLIDATGASYNSGTNSLVWTPLDIAAGQSIEKKFTVRVNPTTSSSVMQIQFNNQLQVSIASSSVAGAKTPPTSAGSQPYKAPVTGNSGSFIVILSLLTTFGIWGVRKWKTRTQFVE